MTWRILIAELKQETATFNPHPTSYDDFRITRGIDILDAYRGTRTEVSGAVDVFESDGHCAVVPTFAAAAVSGGRIVTADLDRLLDELCEAVHQNRDVDAACLCFHGAMAGEDEGDPEGRALAAIREILGDRPIVVSLDLHAVISDRLVDTRTRIPITTRRDNEPREI